MVMRNHFAVSPYCTDIKFIYEDTKTVEAS